jgi:hypothetical protein
LGAVVNGFAEMTAKPDRRVACDPAAKVGAVVVFCAWLWAVSDDAQTHLALSVLVALLEDQERPGRDTPGTDPRADVTVALTRAKTGRDQESG